MPTKTEDSQDWSLGGGGGEDAGSSQIDQDFSGFGRQEAVLMDRRTVSPP